MRRSLALALFLFLAAFTARAAQHGAWHLTNYDNGHDYGRDDAKLQLQLVSDHNQNSHSIERDAFTGLTAAQMSATMETPVDFNLVRDAGTIHFTGTFLDGEGVGRHVVLVAPHGSGVFETKFARALVGKFHKAGIFLAHGWRNLVPAYPGVQQLIRVVAVGQDAAKIAQREALVFSIGLGFAVFAFAVLPVQPDCDIGKLFAFHVVVGSGRCQRQFQQHELARGIGRHFQTVKAAGIQGKLRNHGGKFFLGFGVKFPCIVGNKVFLHPPGAAGAHTQVLRLGFCFLHEGLSFLERGSSLGLC